MNYDSNATQQGKKAPTQYDINIEYAIGKRSLAGGSVHTHTQQWADRKKARNLHRAFSLHKWCKYCEIHPTLDIELLWLYKQLVSLCIHLFIHFTTTVFLFVEKKSCVRLHSFLFHCTSKHPNLVTAHQEIQLYLKCTVFCLFAETFCDNSVYWRCLFNHIVVSFGSIPFDSIFVIFLHRMYDVLNVY